MSTTSDEGAIKNAWIAGLISGTMTLIVTAIAMGGYEIMEFSAWNLLDVALIFGLTFGIYRKSRTCAVIMLVYFVGSKIFIWMEQGGVQGLPLALVFGYYYLQGVKGTFAYHAMAPAPAAEVVQAKSGSVPRFTNRAEYEAWKAQRFANPSADKKD